MQRSGGIYSVLGRAAAYERLQRLLGARSARKRFVEEFLRPFPGARLLDAGCGTGSLLDDLPSSVDYAGFDPNAAYIEAARRRYGHRGSFFCAGVAEGIPLDPDAFDFVVARGVLHHLDDENARHLVAAAHRYLRVGGVLVSSDPTVHDHQSKVARLFIAMDRGRNVRSPDAYSRLLKEHFLQLDARIVTDFLRFPYSHFIARAMKPAST